MHTICWSTPRWTFKGTRENSLCSSGVFFSNSLGVSTELAGKEKESHVMAVYMAVADLSLPPIIPTALGWCYGVCGRISSIMRCNTPLEVNGHLRVRLVLGIYVIMEHITLVNKLWFLVTFATSFLGFHIWEGTSRGILESRNTPYDLR